MTNEEFEQYYRELMNGEHTKSDSLLEIQRCVNIVPVNKIVFRNVSVIDDSRGYGIFGNFKAVTLIEVPSSATHNMSGSSYMNVQINTY